MSDSTSNFPTASGDAQAALAEFFDQYSVSESKEMLWRWYKTATTENYTGLSKVEKENLATFFERITNLMDHITFLK
jgi:hypothetical protein